jgi:hypothetical protein
MNDCKCWVVRTDKSNKELLLKELQEGRLRQGWGYAEDQDLRVVYKKIEKKENLSETQKETLRHKYLFSKFEYGLKTGDIVLIPNLPKQGFFCVAEVVGDYYYQMRELTKEEQVHGAEKDYGHVLPVRLVIKSVNSNNENVDACIRNTFRTPMRMWSIFDYFSSIEKLLKAAKEGENLESATTPREKLKTALTSAFDSVEGALFKKLKEELKKGFHSAEWEEPICELFKALYPDAVVTHKGGAGEKGADILVRIPNYFDEDSPWIIPVQVKNHKEETETGVDAIGQLERAYEAYKNDGEIISLVVITTANKVSNDFTDNAEKLSEKTKVPVRCIKGDEFYDLMVKALLRKPFQIEG